MHGSTSNADPLLVTLTVAQLRELVADVVSEFTPGNTPPEILTRQQAATLLQISVAKLDRLAKDGRVPVRYVGDSPRYLRSELVEMLRGAR